MLVKEILDAKGHEVVTVDSGQPIWTVLRSFQVHHIGALVVVEGGRPIGLLGERDVVTGLIRWGKKVLDLTVRDVMSTPLPTCDPRTSIGTAMRTMTDRRTRHLVVMEGGQVVGIVSIGDVVKARLDDVELENRVLRDRVRSQAPTG
jgi:CBS domain-containing protein